MVDLDTEEMEVFEEAFDIALSALVRMQELRSFDEATHFLAKEIADMMCRGERNVLILSNFALDAYRVEGRPRFGLVQ